MRKMGNDYREGRDRDKGDKFQSFSRPKVKVAKVSAEGKLFVDYKDTETLKKFMSGNGKIQSRRRTAANAMEQRMIARAVKRARYMALLPYIATIA
jgi:small subunit ribosomal protein S18